MNKVLKDEKMRGAKTKYKKGKKDENKKKIGEKIKHSLN